MRLDDNFITELKARNDIVDYISQYVTLQRAGVRLKGLCPFHSEKTASFTVFPDTASYHCFGCKAGGDVITFAMNVEHLSYMDAVVMLAERVRLPLPENDSNDEITNKRRRQLEMHKLAARHFFSNLKDKSQPQAMEYYRRRGLSPSIVTKFGLGYAKDSFDDLRNVLRSAGYSDREGFEAGLLAQSQKNENHYYDKFRNRVMFPVIDVRGNVVAFSGRVLDDSKPKYLNSPETLLYKKGQTVFGLNFAKQSPDETVILVEGNLDVVSLHQAGFAGAIAPLGTAFTREQARLLARYAKTVVVAFDMDTAGIKATDKAISYLEELGITVRILQMNGAKDPDEFIKKYGKERFAMLISGSKNPTQYALDKLVKGVDMTDMTERTEFVRKSVRLLAQISSDIEREMFCSIVAKQAEISKDSVMLEVRRARSKYISGEKKKFERESIASPPTDKVNPERSQNLRAAKAEEGIIALLSRLPDLAPQAKETVPPERFMTEFNRKVYVYFLEKIQSGVSPENVLSAHFEMAEVSKIIHIINTGFVGEDATGQLNDYSRILNEEHEKQKKIGDESPEQLKQMLSQSKRR